LKILRIEKACSPIPARRISFGFRDEPPWNLIELVLSVSIAMLRVRAASAQASIKRLSRPDVKRNGRKFCLRRWLYFH
jgi:hypothetical protein